MPSILLGTEDRAMNKIVKTNTFWEYSLVGWGEIDHILNTQVKCIECHTVVSVGGSIEILNGVSKENLTWKVSFEPRLQRYEGVSHVKAGGERHHRQMG